MRQRLHLYVGQSTRLRWTCRHDDVLDVWVRHCERAGDTNSVTITLRVATHPSHSSRTLTGNMPQSGMVICLLISLSKLPYGIYEYFNHDILYRYILVCHDFDEVKKEKEKVSGQPPTVLSKTIV